MISNNENTGGKSRTRLKKTATAVPTPRSKADMENLVSQIATLKRAELNLKQDMDLRIAAVKGEYEGSLADIEKELAALTTAAETWATGNPEAFGKNKSIKFLQGCVGFRTGTPKLEPLNKKWNWKLITAAVQELLPAFIRSKPELDKEALLAQRDEEIIGYALPRVGLKVTQDESFFVDVETTKTETREVKEVKQ